MHFTLEYTVRDLPLDGTIDLLPAVLVVQCPAPIYLALDEHELPPEMLNWSGWNGRCKGEDWGREAAVERPNIRQLPGIKKEDGAACAPAGDVSSFLS